jgi:hypothetical protein
MRAAGACRQVGVQPQLGSTLASPRMNDRPGTSDLKFVGAWTQLLPVAPAGRVPHCRAVVAHVVATAGRGDRNGDGKT